MYEYSETKVPSVEILLSTYNGEKYIRQLLESVLAQKNVDVHITIRDDGSTDSTVECIKEYNDSRITLTIGKNIGPQRSFLELINIAGKRDYFAYCDQDDVWYDYKLANAVNKIGTSDNRPALYMATYDVVNYDLDFMFTYNMHFERKLTLEETLIYRAPSACTMVFNRRLYDQLSLCNPSFIRMHDFWTLLVAESIGARILVDDRPGMMYRQHAGNTVSITPTVWTRAKRLIKSALTNKNEHWRQAVSLYTERKHLPILKEQKETLKEIVYYRKSIQNRILLMFSKKYKTGNLYIDFLFRFSVLFGFF